MRLGITAIGGVVLSLLIVGEASAQGSKTSADNELIQQADKLKPGEWVWAPEIAPRGPLMIHIDLSQQITTVYRNGVRIGAAPISSGKRGFETPTGVFTILQKHADHRSNKYNNAPMPYMQRLTWDGIALHAGDLPGSPESHGCIRLPIEFAKLLFRATSLGGSVVVDGKAGEPGAPAPKASAASVTVSHPDAPFNWTPKLSPTGPVTVVMSKSDQMIVVLRNGVEIGRSPAMLPTDKEMRIVTLTSPDSAQDWFQVGVPPAEKIVKAETVATTAEDAGTADTAETEGTEKPNRADDAEKTDTPDSPAADKNAGAATTLAAPAPDQERIPPRFEANVRGVLKPGDTILVTKAPISSVTTEGKTTAPDSRAKSRAPGKKNPPAAGGGNRLAPTGQFNVRSAPRKHLGAVSG